MEQELYQLYADKIVIRIRNRVCDTVGELISSKIFSAVLSQYVQHLARQQSRLLGVFQDKNNITPQEVKTLQKTLIMLAKLPADQAQMLVPNSATFFEDLDLLSDFVEQLYNFWRGLHRLIICDSKGLRLDQKPYRTFSDTVEKLMHVVRSAQRDILENVTGKHPRVYRQVSAGAKMAVIALPGKTPFTSPIYKKLNRIQVTRQVLIYPPMIYNSSNNKRSGTFTQVNYNPIKGVNFDAREWLCYPAKVGSLVINVYFSMEYFELGFSLCNLFEIADDEDLLRKPDAIFMFGLPPEDENATQESETIFYDDLENNILVGSVPFREKYGYFGYLKKMILTLHNIKMMKNGRMPFHGAMFHIVLRDAGASNVVLIGDSGAGKSETLEALRDIIEDQVEELTIIADDMGSIEITEDGRVLGYGTEIGAFVRLDDLQKGYALGQIDRTIIMNPDQVNARVVIPVTKYQDIIKGYEIDFVLYANNYDLVDEDHPVIKQFKNTENALEVFRSGAVMSKGTTTTTGLTHSYFANILVPPNIAPFMKRSRKNILKNSLRVQFLSEKCALN